MIKECNEKNAHEILIVDDNPANLQLLIDILEEKGYRVRPATSGSLALKSVAAKVPDLILLDIKMPGIDGFEVCRRLKSDERYTVIPVVFISASDQVIDKVAGFEAGGIDFINKPFHDEELLARVRIHLRLRDLTERLEQKVLLRTMELKDTNLKLQHDITERKRLEGEKEKLESRLTQAQKMEAIGTLAGGIAHDFNNILGAILGYGEMAKEVAPAGTQLEKDLEQVLIAAHRAKDLVQQILTFSRQAQVDRIPIKIQPFIKEGLKMLRSSIPSSISITEDIDPKGGIILADPTQIHQVVMNLGANAYHAMEETGGALSVTLKTTLIGLDEQEMLLHISPGEYIKLTVSDTGSGIDPDYIDNIFDPYFTTKEVGKGTGMGLSIIHGIMKEYGGTITVESQLGKGSTFHVYFPVVKEDFLLEIKEQEDIPRGKERVLFIDDEEILAKMGKKILERLGYHVTVHHSSLEALATFQNTPNDFDIVITDQTMPDMNGSDLARRMMQIRPDVPIILCTGYSNLIDEFSAKAMGIREFALKPLTKEMISKLIRKVLDVS